MKKIKNLKLFNIDFLKKHILPVSIATTIITGAAAFSLEKDPEYVKVSNSVRDSLYRTEQMEQNEGYLEYNSSNYDPNVNDQTLKYLEIVTINGSNKEDFSFLEYCPNIKQLFINNGEFLTADQIDVINKLSFEKGITLNVNIDENTNLEALKKLNNKNLTVVFMCKEFSAYNLLYKSLKGKVKFEDEEKYQTIDKEIKGIIKKHNLKREKTDEETVINAMLGVINYMDYDKDVSNAVMYEIFTGEQDDSIGSKKRYDYNLRDLSITLCNKEKLGLCTNFASILSTTLNELGMEAKVVTGKVQTISGEPMGHAISLVKINDNWKYIDPTLAESLITEEEAKGTENKALKEMFIEDYNENLDIHISLDKSLKESISEAEKKAQTSSYYNEEVEGQKVKENAFDKDKLIFPITFGMENGLLAYSILELLRRRKKMEEEGIDTLTECLNRKSKNDELSDSIEKQNNKQKKSSDFLRKNAIKLSIATGGATALFDAFAINSQYGLVENKILIPEILLFASESLLVAGLTYGGSHLLAERLDNKNIDDLRKTMEKEYKKRSKERKKYLKQLEREGLIVNRYDTLKIKNEKNVIKKQKVRIKKY